MDAVLARYVLVGVVNTLLGYGVILLLQFGAGFAPLLANAAGYAVGLVVSYVLNRRFAFRSRRSHRGGLPAFVAAAAACYGLNALVLFAALRAGVPGALAQAAALTAYTVSFYLLNRYAIFAHGAGVK
jgi:putative flippase GtrA